MSLKLTVVIFLLRLSYICRAQPLFDTVKVDCGNTQLFFQRQCYGDTTQAISFVHVHQNEATALQAVRWLLDSVRQGCIATWCCQQQRFVDFSVGSGNFRFDPNRIYSPEGIRATLGHGATDTAMMLVQNVADTFLQQYILNKKCIVAVHNNADGGGLTIKSYQAKGSYYKDAKAVYINPRQDADDFILTTEEKYFRYLKNKGYNVVLQNNEDVTDDGSLSVFCGQQHIPYINVEAQNGHLLQQKQMLAEVWRMMTEKA